MAISSRLLSPGWYIYIYTLYVYWDSYWFVILGKKWYTTTVYYIYTNISHSSYPYCPFIYIYVYTYKLIDKLCKPCNYIHPDIVSQLLITTILRKLHQTFGRPPSSDGWFLGSMLAGWNTWENPIHMSLPTFIYHLGSFRSSWNPKQREVHDS